MRKKEQTFRSGKAALEKIQRTGWIIRSFFQQGDQCIDSIFNLFLGGRNQSIVNFHRQYDQYDLSQFLRVREADVPQADPLTNYFRQYRF